MPIDFEIADANRDQAALTTLNVLYLDWLAGNIRSEFGRDLAAMLGLSIPEYVARSLAKLCAEAPPAGIFYLVRRDSEIVGMGGLRPISSSMAEMKRVFVLPAGRGAGLGAAIVSRLVGDAERFGYSDLVLDSGPFMFSAHRLYEAAGFRDRPAYPGVEAPAELHHRWRFMQLRLGEARLGG